MKKWFMFLMAFAMGILIASGTYLYINRAPFLAALMTDILKVQVRIGSIDINTDGLVIEKLEIDNPPDCLIRQAFSVDRVDVKANMLSLIKNHVTIQNIQVVNPTLGIEMYSLSGSDNNWKRILNSIASAEEQALQQQKKTESPRVYTIHQFVVTNVQLNVRNQAISKEILHPPAIVRIELKDIGTDKPVTMRQMLDVLFRTILNQATSSQGLQNILREAKRSPGEYLKNLWDKTFGSAESSNASSEPAKI